MSEQTLELKVGDHLIRNEGGGFAEVTSIEYDATSNAKHPPVFGYHIAITEPDKSPREALIRVVDLPGFLSKWHINGKPLTEAVALDTELTATATVIADLREQVKQLRERNAHLEARNAELNESLESATAHDAAGSDLIAEVDARTEVINQSREIAIQRAVDAETRVAELTAQLAEARLASAPIQSAPAADHTVAPTEEICVIRDITQHLFTEKINQGWRQIHMQFMPGEERDTLNVVFVKTMPAPVDYSPRKHVATVGNMVTIIPPAEVGFLRPTERAEADLQEVLNYGKQVYDQALAASPIPAFHPLSLSSGVK